MFKRTVSRLLVIYIVIFVPSFIGIGVQREYIFSLYIGVICTIRLPTTVLMREVINRRTLIFNFLLLSRCLRCNLLKCILYHLLFAPMIGYATKKTTFFQCCMTNKVCFLFMIKGQHILRQHENSLVIDVVIIV